MDETRPLHLALVIGEFLPSPGGIATYAGHLARLLGEGGARVDVLTPDATADGPLPPNVTLHRAPSVSGGTGAWLTDVLAATSNCVAWSTARLEQIHAADPLDAIEVTDYYMEGLFLEPERLQMRGGQPVPVITQFHGSRSLVSGLDGQAVPPLLLKLEKLLMADSPLRKTYSPRMQAEVAQLWPDAPCAFVPPPFYRPDSPPRAAGTKFACDFLYFGRLQHFKGVEPYAKALRLLAERGVRPRVAFIGGDTPTAPGGGSMLAWLESELRPLYGDRLAFRPALPRAEVWRAVAAARAIVLPSLWESLGFTILEAACSGRPVLVSRGAGAAYVFDNNDAPSALVDVHDTPRFAESLARWHGLSDAELQRLAEAQRAAVERELAPARVRAATLDCYRRAARSAAAVTAERCAASAGRRAAVDVLGDCLRLARARRREFERLRCELDQLVDGGPVRTECVPAEPAGEYTCPRR